MAEKRKSGLGRGLAALIPSTEPAARAEETESLRRAHDEIDLDLIVPNPHQPRSFVDPDGLEELAQSIRQHGIIQPLLVSRVPSDGGVPTYQLIAGERRLQAARLAGLDRVPVVVREAASHELLELALIENVQRRDLTPLEEAQAYRRLVDEFGLTQEAVAERVGKSRTAVANTLRLLSLPAEVKASLSRGEISEGHARALLGLADDNDRRAVCQIVVDGQLTVRQTEELVRTWGVASAASKRAKVRSRPAPDADVAALEERLRSLLGTKVRITRGRAGTGRIVIHFYSEEDLASLVDVFGGNISAFGGR